MLSGYTYRTEIGVTFSNSEVAGTLFCIAMSFAPTSRESIMAVGSTLAELLTEITKCVTLTIVITMPS